MNKPKSLILHPFEVRGIIAGTLTQIRRPVESRTIYTKDAFWDHSAYEPIEIRYGVWAFRAKDSKQLCTAAAGSPVFKCPLGKVGDTVIGKETWHFINANSEHSEICIAYDADGPCLPNRPSIKVSESEFNAMCWDNGDPWTSKRKRSASSMPAWASRITLRLESIRVQRVQEIS